MVPNFPKMAGSETMHALAALGSNRMFRKGETLFQQGHPAQGVYVIEQGEVRIFLSSAAKKREPFHRIGAGGVLGLGETVSGREYSITAEAVEQTTASYIERGELMKFLHENCEICMHIVRLLSEDLHVLYHKFRVIKSPGSQGKRKSLRSVN